MKAKKRLFAGMLALAMLLSLNVTAFASAPGAGGETKYTDSQSVTIKKSYEIANAGTSAPAENFKLKVVTSKVADGEATEAPGLTISQASFEDSVSQTSEAVFTITLPKYERVGVYVYELKEDVPETETAGVTYDVNNTSIFLKVTVVRQDGVLVRVVSLREGEIGDKYDDESNPATITNKYEAGSLTVAKNVTGLLGDTDKYFTFKVTVNNPEGEKAPTSYTVDTSEAIGDGENENPTTIVAGRETTFRMKSGEEIVINNLPYGVTYTTSEVEANEDDYVTTCEDSDTTNDNTIDEVETTVTYTNSKGAGEEIDTGIYLDNLPYIIVFAGVLAAVAVLVIRRRRVDD